MNYVPNSLKMDSISKLENKTLKTELNNLGNLHIYSRFIKKSELNESDKNWLDNRIAKIATALFLDGKKIILSNVGGASGCPNRMLDTIKLNNIEIINLKFCYTCTEPRDENFTRIFNSRMYSLMKIEPSNKFTKSFYGEFRGRNKIKQEMKLVMKDDRTFKFWLNKGHGSDFTEGLWKNKSDMLILNSKTLTRNDSLTFALSSAKWIEFNGLNFRLKKGKLFEMNNGKRKLKKKVE